MKSGETDVDDQPALKEVVRKRVVFSLLLNQKEWAPYNLKRKRGRISADWRVAQKDTPYQEQGGTSNQISKQQNELVTEYRNWVARGSQGRSV